MVAVKKVAAALPLAWLLLAAALAGCSDDADAKPDAVIPEGAFDEVEADATADTGIIRGVVLDEAVKPLADAQVVVPIPGAKALQATTTDNGVFAFDGLQPGTYFLRVSKPGYNEVQQSTDVAAGVEDPPVLKVMLTADPGTLPFLEEFKLDGFMQCGGVAVVITFSAPCTTALGDEDARGAVYTIAANATWFQSEMTWEANTALADRFDLDFGFARLTSTSPIVLSTDAAQMGELATAGGDVPWIVWPMGMEGSDVGGLWGVGLVLQQDFQVFTFFFHNYAPPAGWSFIHDGPASPPL